MRFGRLGKEQRSRVVRSDEAALVPAHLVLQNLVILGEGEHAHGEALEIRRVLTARVEGRHVAIFMVRAATGINGVSFYSMLAQMRHF